MAKYSPAINNLITQLASLPGIGQKSAQRLAFHILSIPAEKAEALAQSILEAKRLTRFCSKCCNLTDQDPCEICVDEKRDKHIICVVENPSDVAAMERTREYRGRYHVLHGAISPMNNIGPEEIRLKELLGRLRVETDVSEVILANNATVEGEATALYIAKLLKPAGIRTTRIAHGIPMGSNLEFTDEVTLSRALSGRIDI